MRFEPMGGCGSYLRGYIILEVGLPEKRPNCQYCTMVKYEEAFNRYSCRAVFNRYWIHDPFHGRPEWCPIEWTDNNDFNDFMNNQNKPTGGNKYESDNQ